MGPFAILSDRVCLMQKVIDLLGNSFLINAEQLNLNWCLEIQWADLTCSVWERHILGEVKCVLHFFQVGRTGAVWCRGAQRIVPKLLYCLRRQLAIVVTLGLCRLDMLRQSLAGCEFLCLPDSCGCTTTQLLASIAHIHSRSHELDVV